MSRNRTLVAAPPEVVFAVLSDPRTYARFTVGTKRIRRFDPRWPEVGSVFHHTLGVGPLILHDLSRVVELDEGRRLVLRAQMRPFAVNRVAFELRPSETGTGTHVDIEEHAIEGPAGAVWNPVLEGLLWLRNQELLRRLKHVAERRARRALAGTRL